MADNYTQVPNWMIAKIYRDEDLQGPEFRVLMYIVRKLNGFHKKSDKIPYSQISEATGIDRRSVIRIVKALERKKWISVKRKEKCTNIIRLVGGGTDATRGGGTDGRNLVAQMPPSKENQKSGLSSSPPLVGVDSQDKINNKTIEELEAELGDEYE